MRPELVAAFFVAWMTGVVLSTIRAHRRRWSITRFVLDVVTIDLAAAVMTTLCIALYHWITRR